MSKFNFLYVSVVLTKIANTGISSFNIVAADPDSVS